MTYGFFEEEKEINWDDPNGFAPNRKIKNTHGMIVYSHEPYAEELAAAYSKQFGNLSSHDLTKDLTEGDVYGCKVVALTEAEAFAQTESGQTIYIDLKKEKRDADKLGIGGIDFTVDDLALHANSDRRFFGLYIDLQEHLYLIDNKKVVHWGY